MASRVEKPTAEVEDEAEPNHFSIWELGNKAAQEELPDAKTIDDGPQLQLCLDVATRLVSVSEHLFPREYEWRVWLVDNPSSANVGPHRLCGAKRHLQK
ncbi:metalloendopeptidase [Phytophthora boehmeriae]|uniref:Metalloendopeptidase n=1 Tax=Phytophthora boehmeriae TaxID=109152 RepID=A0A8T1VPC8_9STRA|nr:metalloendopeptidase [Phytophthora boehmeriae]